MNRKWIIPLVIAVAAGIVAYEIAWSTICSRSGPSLDRLQDVSFLTRELRLSDEQASEIKSLHATLGAELDGCCRAHCAARARLGQALATDTNGNQQVEAIVTEMSRAYEESEWVTLNHMRAVRALLNAGQRSRFDAMITNCMCETCSMPGRNKPPKAVKHE